MRALHLLAGAALLLAPLPALAEGWRHYAFDDAGFAVQAPAEPVAAKGVFRTEAGLTVPQTTYYAREDDIVYSVSVADFNGTAMTEQAAINAAVKALKARGELKVDVTERIDVQFGRELTIAGKDGSQTQAAVFFVNHKLYELAAVSQAGASGKAIRFQQSLEFIGLGAEANRPENRAFGEGGPPGGGPGGRGPGGRPGPPPPQAFFDCRGKAEGASVQHTLPDGQLVPATCITTPQGLAARPLRPPQDGQPPEG